MTACCANRRTPFNERLRLPRSLHGRAVFAFYAAFGVEEGDEMYLSPDERVEIW